MAQRDEARVLDLSNSNFTEAKLVGFRINSAELQLVHKTWLNDNIVPIMLDGGSAVLAGYASRSGSAAHNLKLSGRRAEAVAGHIRIGAAGRGMLSMSAITVNPAFGETAAAAAGQKDGTEDALYRAVHVKAWRKPVLPPPPVDKPAAAKKHVVVFRRWTKSQYNMPTEPGGIGGDIGDIIKDVTMPDMGDSRSFDFPSDYAVNRVRDEFTVEWEMMAGGSDTTYTREISYTWGPRADQVHLLKQSRYLQQGGRWIIQHNRFFSRSEIWKHTIAPDGKVSGV